MYAGNIYLKNIRKSAHFYRVILNYGSDQLSQYYCAVLSAPYINTYPDNICNLLFYSPVKLHPLFNNENVHFITAVRVYLKMIYMAVRYKAAYALSFSFRIFFERDNIAVKRISHALRPRCKIQHVHCRIGQHHR